jgi:hypothetical protein
LTRSNLGKYHARGWALERWPENAQVNLAEELPSLKALIRTAREHAIAASIDPDAIDMMEEGGLQGQSQPLSGASVYPAISLLVALINECIIFSPRPIQQLITSTHLSITTTRRSCSCHEDGGRDGDGRRATATKRR